MTAANAPLDTDLLALLDGLGLSEAVAPSGHEWSACLLEMSKLLRQREQQVTTRSRRVVGRLGHQARSAERVFQAFLTTMSHELRTPIAVVLGCLEMLGCELDDQRRETVVTGRRAALELIRTIDAILDYCRIEAGELGLVKRSFDLRRLLSDVVARYETEAERRGISLEYRGEPRLPCRVMGDAHRIEQVLDALIDNAMKFTGTGFVRVACVLEQAGAGELLLRFAVSDSGRGIARRDQEKIFAPFQQLDGSPSRRHGGIGLGLALAGKLVDTMGGRLGVTSAPGKGSEFHFSLRLPAVQVERRAGRKPRVPRRDVPRLLLAEDNDFNRAFVVRCLEPLGCSVRAVSHGQAVLDAIAEYDPDLVLMDVQMPEMDGLTAARRIRELPQPYSSVPIVALTANAQHADRARCEDAGMDDVLPKPISVDALRTTIARWLRLPTEHPSGDEKAPPTEPARQSAPELETPSLADASPVSGTPRVDATDLLEGSRCAGVGELLAGAGGILDLGRVEELVQQAGSAAILRELSEIFLEDMGVRLENLSAALSAGDREEVQRLAHAVKGSSVNFGALEVARYAERLEMTASSAPQQDDFVLLEEAFIQVRRVLQQVLFRNETDDVA